MVTAGRSGTRYDLSHPNARRNRLANKFIPDGDSDFALMARHFASMINRDPSRYLMAADDARAIAEAVVVYRDALAKNTHRFTKSMQTVALKDEARRRAEQLIREAGNFIRSSSKIDSLAKRLANVNPRPEKLRKRTVPQTPPQLSFAGDRVPYSNTIDGKHVIHFRDPFGKDTSNAKPAGAERLELYYELVPPGEPIPQYPGQRTGGHRFYLRSFKRSPLTIEYPKCDEPMRIVYWGCWADSSGKQGPFSQTLATKFVGFDAPTVEAPRLEKHREQTIIITSAQRALPELIDTDTVEATPFNDRRLLHVETAEAA
jgi:hypothetical protein